MIKNKAVVEVKLNDRIYSMECPSDAPLGEVHDALCMMKRVVVDQINLIINQENKKSCESNSCEE